MKKRESKIQFILDKLNSISWIDYAGLILVGLLIFSLAFFFLRRGETVQVVVRLSESATTGYVNWGDRTPAWFLDRIEPGLSLYDRFDRPVIKVVDTYSFQPAEGMQVAYITLEVRAIYDKNSQNYIYNGVPLLIGTYQSFKIADFEIQGVLYDIGQDVGITQDKKIRVKGFINPEPEDRSTFEAESISDGIKNYLADQFEVGLQSVDSKNQPLVQVVEVAKKPSTRMVVDGGVIKKALDPDRKRIDATLDIKANQFGDAFYYEQEAPIRTGIDLWIDFEKFGVFFTITDIESVTDL